MAFVEVEKEVFKPQLSAVEKLDKLLEELPKEESQAALNILVNASTKKAMIGFRKAGYPLGYDTLIAWKEKHNVV